MNALISWVLPRAWRRGVLGGNRAWLAAGAAALVARTLRKAVKKEERVVLREEILPGERLVIEHLPRPR